MSWWWTFGWWRFGGALLFGFIIAEFNLYLVTAVLHRGMCHRAIAYPTWLKRGVVLWLWLTVCTSALSWIATHLHHHANSDGEEDPHAPGMKGFWHVLLLTWYYVPGWARANWESKAQRYLAPLRADRLLWWLERPVVFRLNFYLQALGSLMLGPIAAAFWLSRFVPYLIASGYVNAVAHTAGERPYGPVGTDAAGVLQKLAGYVVGGEPLGHNFHHRHPTSASFRPNRFDPGLWFAIRVLRGIPRGMFIGQSG
jgi:stearoyl-CoA desaturase (Delta-9 desaturase)